MNSKFDFDLLFKKTETVDFKSLDIFRKAALLYQVNHLTDLNEFTQEDIQAFKDRSFKNSDGTHRLNEEDRMVILKNGIGAENIPQHIEKFNVQSVYSDLLKMLSRVKSAEEININLFTNEEVFYAILLADLFPNILNKDLLKGIYQRRQFFKQFERITKNFAGRQKELERISDYVDWMPKSGMLNKIYAGFRNIINWHDKPPLLIKGIGGIGKSTLVAEFIMEQNGHSANGNLPFVYIDFDLPGFTLKEPMTILIEALRQINIQYPQHTELINCISQQVSNLILTSKEEPDMIQATNATTRNYIYGTIEDIIKGNNLDFETIGKKPILIVLDSFEEMQYRASTTELFSFYQFIREISEKLPRIRPIFAGRSELNMGVDDFKFDQLELKEFDAESADSLLEKSGVRDKNTRNFIFENFGGNPLMLTLATDLTKREDGFDFKNYEKIKGKKWQYLIGRILGHIHNDDVRKIAVPGMLVRSISPEVILEILAGPTKIGYTDSIRAENIFYELQKEVALISKANDGDSFSFRQDLRMTCEPMILENFPIESREIRDNAIKYYSQYRKIEDIETSKKHQAEYYFHLMKNHQIPAELDSIVYDQLRPFMENYIIELPPECRRYIDSLNKQMSSAETLENSNINLEEWEQYNLGLLKDALNGEVALLENVYETLRAKKPRVNNGFSEFGKYEALVYQRLNKIPLSRDFINKALQKGRKPQDHSIGFELQLLQIQNYEYEQRFKEALSLCKSLEEQSRNVRREDRKKYEFLRLRIENRLGQNRPINSFQEFIKDEPFYADESFRDTKWEFIFNQLQLDGIRFKKDFEIAAENRKLKTELNHLNTLEHYAKETLNFFLKDITNTGHFNIVLFDVIYVEEIIKKEDRY